MSTTTVNTATFEHDGFPRASVVETRNSISLMEGTPAFVQVSLSAVLDNVEGIDPQRELTGEEIVAGISSLNPPTVATNGGPQALIDVAARALEAAVVASGRSAITGPNCIMLRYKAAVAVSHCLRDLGYEV